MNNITFPKLPNHFKALVLALVLYLPVCAFIIYLTGCNQMMIANQGAGHDAQGSLVPQSPTTAVDTSASLPLIIP